VPRSYERAIVFMLTNEDVLACAMELGIAEEQVTSDVMELVKRRVRLEFSRWPEEVKAALKEAIKCPLGLDCYPSCAWWQDGKCTFSEQVKQETRKGETE